MARGLLFALGLAAMALVGSAKEAVASAPGTYGFGSRSSALGGAVAADAPDPSACFYNPAALVGAPGLGLSVGYMYADNRLRINGKDNDVVDVHGLMAGIVAPGKIGRLPFAFGIGTYMPDDGLSRIRALRQETPRWELYNDRPTILFLTAQVAIRPLPWLEIGAGLAFLAATRGRFGIRGEANVLRPFDSQLEHEVDADLTSIRYPIAGVRFKLGSLGYLGLAYRGQTKLDLALEANLVGNVNFAGVQVPLTYSLATRTIDAFQPQQVVAGFSFQAIKGLHANLDLGWVNWSAYESPTAKTTAHLEAELPPGVNIDLPEDPKAINVVPPAFEDRIVPRLGVEYTLGFGSERKVSGREEKVKAVEVPLRVGYVYEASPVPPQTGLTNFVDADRHTISFGTGVVLNAPFSVLQGALRVDAHGALSVLPERVTQKTSAADFVGDYRADGLMIAGGATVTASF
jgi:long-subunit fatty acid transport protein